jgi:uncharacterized membrane protein HdeD (DUF308 family)
MLAVLAASWGLLMLRALAAALFGIFAVSLPGLTATGLVFLFAAYVLIDGALALAVALGGRGVPGSASFFFDAAVRLATGIIVLAAPDQVARGLSGVVAAWAVAVGFVALAQAFALRKELAGEWPLPTAAAVSFLAAAFLVASPGAARSDLSWVVGPYSMIFGAALLILSVRLRQLALEMGVK